MVNLFSIGIFILLFASFIQYGDLSTIVTSPTTSPYTTSLNENVGVGYQILIIQTNKSDSSAVVWNFASGDTTYFQLTPSTTDDQQATITLKLALDYETSTSKSVIVNIIHAGQTSAVTISVTVLDAFDVAPVFNPTTYACSLPEEAIGTCTVSVSDVEISHPTPDAITCTLSGTNSAAFTIDSSTCHVTLTSAIDREGASVITSYPGLLITAKDKGNNIATASLSVTITDINDNTPTCPGATLIATKDEGFTGDIFSATCTDADAGVNQALECSTTQTGITSTFTGSTCKTSITTTFDHESITNPITFDVIVKDKAVSNIKSATLSYTLTISDINDNTPSCTPPTSLTITKPESYTGTIFSTTCVDSDKSAVYKTLSCTSSDSRVPSSMSTGPCVTSISPAIDYDNLVTNPFQFTVTIVDMATNSVDRRSTSLTYTLTITDENDNKPACSPSSGSITKTEYETGEIFRTTCTDGDKTTEFKTLACSASDSKVSSTMSGGDCITSIPAKIDYETLGANPIIFTVEVRDSATDTTQRQTSTVSYTLTITDMNDIIPSCVTTTGSITKTELETGRLFSTTCTDLDGTTPNKLLVCSTNQSGVTSSMSGSSCVTDITTAIDYDTLVTNPIIFTVIVSDSATNINERLSATLTYTLTITDVNDNTPSCTPATGTVSKTESFIGTVFTSACTDNDKTTDFKTLVCSSSDSRFSSSMSGGNCITTISSAIDYDTLSSNILSFTVEVRDSATNVADRKTTTISYTVTITDENDNKPACGSMSGSISKTELESGVLFTTNCSDNDKTTEFNQLVCTSSDSRFSSVISGANCITTMPSPIDYDALISDTITFTVSVRDSAIDTTVRQTATLSYTVTITDVNDNPPNCTTTTGAITKTELETGQIFTTACTDGDRSAPNNQLSCTTTQSSISSAMSGTNCVTQIATAIDYDTLVTNPIIFNVIVNDMATASKQTVTLTYTLTITDVNDNTPNCSPTTETITKTELEAGNIFTSACTDGDKTTEFKTLACSASDSKVSSSMSGGNCVTTIPSAIDYDTLTSNPIVFTVSVHDSATDTSVRKTATLSYTLTITDINDNFPICSKTTLVTSKSEKFTGEIFSTTCTDADSTVNSQLSCSTSNSLFTSTISSNTCKTSINTAIDFESLTTNPIIFPVIVNDNAVDTALRKTDTLTYTITITNEWDVAPVFTQASYACSINEETTTNCTMISVSDTETVHTPPDVITCSLTGPNIAYFEIFSPSCVVRPKAGIDFDVASNPNSYPNLIITATDKGSNTATASLSVTIVDLNDNSPVCSSLNVINTQTEAYTGLLNSISCTDADSGAFGQVACSTTETKVSVAFSTTSNTCNVNIVTAIDYEDATLQKPLKFDIIVHDNDPTPANKRTTTVSYTLTITDLNDNTPDCGTPVLIATKSEHFTGNVFTTACTDKDSTTNGALVCTNTDSRFNTGIVSQDCKIDLNSAIDFEPISTNPIITFVVTVRDNAVVTTDRRSISHTYTVTITNEWDVAPVFTQASYACSIIEETTTNCTMISVSDVETAYTPPDAITCSLTGPNADLFEIYSPSCIVKPKLGIDRDASGVLSSYPNLVIKATDKGSNTATASLSVTIVDLNDNAPNCGTTAVTQTKDEKYTGSLSILPCTDKDSLDKGQMSCFGNDSRIAVSFVTATSTCNIGLSTAIDYDTLNPKDPIYSLIFVHDNDVNVTNRHTTTITYTLTITNVFDVAPVFTASSYSCSLPEESLTEECSTISVSDIETAYNPADIITCVVTGTNSHYFDSNSPTCKLKQKIAIDRDLQGAITSFPTLLVTALDKNNNSATASVSVTISDLNDNSPNCGLPNAGGTIFETFSGNFHTLNCMDIDAGNNAILGCSTNETKVTINMLGSKCFIDVPSPLDYDTMDPKFFKFNVLVFDTSTNVSLRRTSTYSLTVTIENVFDIAPVFNGSPFSCNIPDDTVTACTTVNVTDKESSYPNPDYITCTLSGSGSNYFNILSPSCQIQPIIPIDRDDASKPNSFPNLVIVATDRGGLASTGTISISITDVNDNAPKCGNSAVTTSFLETFTGTFYTLVCSDRDDGVNSQLVCATTETNVAISTSGSNCVLNVNTALNYETFTPNPLVFTVTVRDSATVTADQKTTTVTFTASIKDVFDVAPVFNATSYTCTMEEESLKECTNIFVSDVEIGHIPTDEITCTLSGTNSDLFLVPSQSCTIRPKTAIDRDKIGQITSIPNLILKATDKGSNTATTTLSVSITDINDNTPSCNITTSTVTKAEDYTGTIFTIPCSDPDDGVNGALQCSTTTTGLSAVISGTDCVVSISPTAIDYDTLSTNPIIFPLKVNDQGTITRSTTYTLTLSITGIEDNAVVWDVWVPVWTSDTATIKTILENTPIGTELLISKAKDGDKGIGGSITYAITQALTSSSTNKLASFSISNTGIVTLIKSDLDRETDTFVSITITATDGTTTLTRVAKIELSDANEKAPEFTPINGIYSKLLDENSPINTEVIPLVVKDPDASNVPIICSIQAGDPSGIFTIATGNKIVLQKAMTVDKPTSLSTSYILIVSCKDNLLTSTATVSVSVKTDSNDHQPVVTPATQTVSIPENQPNGEIVTYSANDNDAGDAGTLTCSLVASSTLFQATSCSKLSLISSLDYETATSHTIEIKVTDAGTIPKSVTTTITINVININDNIPICTTTPASIVTQPEQVAPVSPLELLTIPCSDADETNSSETMKIIGGDYQQIFSITDNKLFLVKALDYETFNQYNLIIRYMEKSIPYRTAQMTVKINVTPVNEATPTFTSNSFQVSISEAAEINTPIGFPYTAVDSDTGPHGIVKYELKSATDTFAISNNTGQLTLLKKIDYDTMGADKFITTIVHAVDGGGLTGSTTVTVSILDVNDNSPTCDSTPFSATIAENSAPGTNLTTGIVKTTDNDGSAPHNTVNYQIVKGDNTGSFVIDSSSGQISVSNKGVDYEVTQSFNLLVKAQDGAGGGLNSVTCTMTITVEDVNEATPIFPKTNDVAFIKEDAAINANVHKLVATDEDKFQTLTYSLSSTTTFNIDGSTGQITLKVALDYETTNLYTVTISAIDNGVAPKTGSYTLTVSVVDVNEFNPTCTSASLAGNVIENALVDATIGSIICTDTDPTSTLTYFTSTVPFKMSGNSVKLSTSNVIDYESSTKSYNVIIEVRDDAILPKKTVTVTFVATVDPFNEFVPTITNTQTSFVIPESTTQNTLITTITSTDADQGSNHATLTYSITNGNGAGKFIIDSTTGELKLANTIDYDTESKSYSIEITVTDGGGKKSTIIITITITDVNDNSPISDTNPLTVEIAEDFSINTLVKDLSSHLSDKDSGVNAQIGISIKSGNTDNYFKVNGLKILVNISPMDAATNPLVTLVITLTDSGIPSLTTDINLAITVKDKNLYEPKFGKITDTVNIPEDKSINSIIYTASATDGDKPSTDSGKFEFSIDPVTNPSNFFSITALTGTINLIKALDRETLAKHILILYVKDKGIPIKTGTLSLTIVITDINDNAPIFSNTNEFTKSIFENMGSGYHVLNVLASDADEGNNAKLSYAIQSQPATLFQIDSNTGRLTTAVDINREQYAKVTLTIRVSDQGSPPKFTDKVFEITIADRNDNDPVFAATSPITKTVTENQNSGITVGTATATDADQGLAGTVSYSLKQADTVSKVSYFSIDASGLVQTTVSLDREEIAEHRFYVVATDGGPGIRSSSILMIVKVGDENDNAPKFQGTPIKFSIPENRPSSYLVGTLVIIDIDDGINSEIIMNMTSDDFEFKTPFQKTISTNGTITQVELIVKSTNPLLDYEIRKSIDVNITVFDNGTVPKSSFTTVTVLLTDLNDNTCQFSYSSYTFKVKENTNANVEIGTVLATDKDSGSFGAVIYKLHTNIIGVYNDYMIIDSSNGKLQTTQNKIDRESTSQFKFLVLCMDSSSTPLTGTSTIIVDVEDENEFAPEIIGDYSQIEIAENKPANTEIIKINATDKDSGVNAIIVYNINTNELDGQLANKYFMVNSTTGLVQIKSSLTQGIDRENVEKTTISFLVNVFDSAVSNQLSSSVQLNILITDVNDNSPVFIKQFYSTEIAYNVKNGYQVDVVQATDKDTGINAAITYEWVENVDHFNLDKSTGKISKKTSSNLTPDVSYVYQIKAKDAGTPTTNPGLTKIRIDTFDPAKYTIALTIVCENFDKMSNTIIELLTKTIRKTYSEGRVGLMYTETLSSSSRTKRSLLQTSTTRGFYYAVSDTTADDVNGLKLTKKFVPIDNLSNLWIADKNGNPHVDLLSPSFGNVTITKAEKYNDAIQSSINTAPAAQTTQEWIQSTTGIIVISCVTIAVLLIIIIPIIYYKCTHRQVHDARQFTDSNNQNNRQNLPAPYIIDFSTGRI